MSLFNYECDEVKRIIDEVSPNYPQLTTYEKEWLYFHKYGYIPGIPVELEYQEVIVNPMGTVQNAIPYSYKRAILKGNTKYRDIDTGDILDTFDETKNLELVSVNMPVLKTTGKNLFDMKSMIDDERVYEYDEHSITIKNSVYNISEILGLKHDIGEQYTIVYNREHISGDGDAVFAYRYIDDSITYINPNNPTPSSTTKKLKCIELTYGMAGISKLSNICLFKGIDFGLTYEPYKSNILTTSEEVELRGIGDVKDELDLLTGEYVQRIGELVLDGVTGLQDWRLDGTNETTGISGFYLANSITGYNFSIEKNQYVISNEFKTVPLTEWKNRKEEACIDNTGNIAFLISNSKLSEISSDGFKQYLSQNPITIQYKLAKKSIKTVDLTPLTIPYEGTNHYQLTANIPCEAILEVPVVSTGEQTLQEINN